MAEKGGEWEGGGGEREGGRGERVGREEGRGEREERKGGEGRRCNLYTDYTLSCPTHCSKVTVTLDSDGQLPVSTSLAINDGPEVLDELSEDGCICFVVFGGSFNNVDGHLHKIRYSTSNSREHMGVNGEALQLDTVCKRAYFFTTSHTKIHISTTSHTRSHMRYYKSHACV